MRGKLALFGGFGPVFLIGGLIAGVGAVANASTVSAYDHATVCPSGAALDADCLQTVDGSVSGVTEVGGKDAHYALYAQVGSRTLDVTFGSDNQMLGNAADGDSAEVSVWRGIPVAVQSNGYSEIPNSVPASSAWDWVLSIGCLVLGFVILLGSLLKWRRQRRTGTWVPASRSATVRQSRPKPVSVRQQHPLQQQQAAPSIRLRAALGHLYRLPKLGSYLSGALAVALLILLVSSMVNAFNIRAFRDAPACQGENNLSVCVGNFTGYVNGVRTSPQNTGTAEISYATADGVINNWGNFSGNGQALADTAKAEETARAPITIEVWKDGIVGAEIGATWYWTSGNPPSGTLSVVFLAAFVALELLLIRCRADLRARSSRGSGIKAERRRLALEDVCQVGVSAVGIWLLLSTYWWGGLFIVGVAGWACYTLWQTKRSKAENYFVGLSDSR
jgi:hypothetical protein